MNDLDNLRISLKVGRTANPLSLVVLLLSHTQNNFYLKIDITGKSSFYYSDSHNNKSKSYQLANLLIGYSNKKLSVDFWGRNLFDEYYSTRGFFFGNEAPNFEDTLYRRQGDPKNIGLSLRYNF